MSTERARHVWHPGDRSALLGASGLLCLLFALGAASQAAYVYGELMPGSGDATFVSRMMANGACVGADLLVLAGLRTELLISARARGLALVAAASVAAGLRVVTQDWAGVYPRFDASTASTELVGGLTVALTANALGLAFMLLTRRARAEAHAAAVSAMEVERALGALHDEEIRIRREVAEGLHGSLQQRLLIASLQLGDLAAALAASPATAPAARTLTEVGRDLDRLREGDVRELSRMLYPDGLDVGMVPAIRNILGRLPSSVGTRLTVDDLTLGLDDPVHPGFSQAQRLLAVRVVEEALTNALRHGRASSLEVHLETTDHGLHITVMDDGTGFDTASGAVVRSGTSRLADRLAFAGGRLTLRSAIGRGTVVEAIVALGAAQRAGEATVA